MQAPCSAVPILERLIKRTDLPSDVVATLQIAAVQAAFSETASYEKGYAAGMVAGRQEVIQRLLPPSLLVRAAR